MINVVVVLGIMLNMKKILLIISMTLALVLLLSCVSTTAPEDRDTSAQKETEGTTAVDTTNDLLSEEITTFVDDTTAEDTTQVSVDTTAVENGWESVVYEEDGYEIIVGSSTLYGDPSDTTFSSFDANTDEIISDIESGIYDGFQTEDTDISYDTSVIGDMEDGESYPPVFMYHCVHDEPYTENTSLFVRPSELEGHLQVIKELGIETLFADEFGLTDKKSVILTFDDGYEDNYTYMFPLIKKYNVKVTVYMIAYKIDKPGYLTSEQIKEMSDSGLVQFGSHTLDHPSLTSVSEDAMREQFAGSNWLISKITGKPVTTIAYPSGRYNDTVMDIASEYYEFAFTTDRGLYSGQYEMMIPRYFIMRGMSKAGFRTYLD